MMKLITNMVLFGAIFVFLLVGILAGLFFVSSLISAFQLASLRDMNFWLWFIGSFIIMCIVGGVCLTASENGGKYDEE